MAYPEPHNLNDIYGPGAENADDGIDEVNPFSNKPDRIDTIDRTAPADRNSVNSVNSVNKGESLKDEAAEIFALAHAGGDRNIQAACDRIIAMTDLERRDLRVALRRLDGMLDALALDRHLKRKR